MKVEEGQQLPPILYNASSQEVLKLFYEGASKICHNCHGQGHTISFCKQKSVLADFDPSMNTWAAIAASKQPSFSKPKKVIPVTRVRSRRPSVDLTKDYPPLGGATGANQTGAERKSPEPVKPAAPGITTKNSFDILNSSEMTDGEDIITETQTTEKAEKKERRRSRRGAKGGDSGAKPTGGSAPLMSDSQSSMGGELSQSLPCNQAGLLTPSTVDSSQDTESNTLNLVYQGSFESQSLISGTPDSLRIDSFHTQSLDLGVGREAQSLIQSDNPENPGEPGDPGEPPGETHLKRGFIRTPSSDSPHKKKLFSDT